MASGESERETSSARRSFESNPLYQQPQWVAAHQRVQSLLPSSADTIAAPYNLVPDTILDLAKLNGVPIEAVVLFNPWRGDLAGYGTTPFEDYETLALFDLVFAERPPTPGLLWFIPDDCLGNTNPHLIHAEDLRAFVQSHDVELNSDALFIWTEIPRITIIHHSGAYFNLVFPSDQ